MNYIKLTAKYSLEKQQFIIPTSAINSAIQTLDHVTISLKSSTLYDPSDGEFFTQICVQESLEEVYRLLSGYASIVPKGRQPLFTEEDMA